MPSFSAACCRAAPMPTRLAVEPPDVKVPTYEAGKPSSSSSQRTAMESRWLPGWIHQRCGLATAWARCAAVAMVEGAVVTQPVKPGWPVRRPRGMTTSRSVSRTASAPTPTSGSGSSRAGQPGRAWHGSIRPLEAVERLQRRQQRGDGLGQRVGAGHVRLAGRTVGSEGSGV